MDDFLFSVVTPRELNIIVGICKYEHRYYYKANSDGNLHYASLCSVRFVSLTSCTREGWRAFISQGEVIPIAKHCTGGDTWPRPSRTFSWFFWAPISYTKCLILVKYGPWTVVSGDFPGSVQKGQVWPLRALSSISQFSLLHGVFACFWCSI